MCCIMQIYRCRLQPTALGLLFLLPLSPLNVRSAALGDDVTGVRGQGLRAPSSGVLLISSPCPTSFPLRCRYGQQDKGPGEEWSYGSKKGRDGEKAKERDSMDYPAPVLAYYPPVDIWMAVSVCPMSWWILTFLCSERRWLQVLLGDYLHLHG